MFMVLVNYNNPGNFTLEFGSALINNEYAHVVIVRKYVYCLSETSDLLIISLDVHK